MADPREYEVVSFNGVRFPCAPTFGYQNTGTFEGKVVDGDYTRDSDKYMSAKIWTDWSGGIGKDSLREGADDGRYWFGLVNAEKPFQLSLPEQVESYAAVQYPLGDVLGHFYGADGAKNLWVWDEATKAFTDTTANLTELPVWRGTSWNSKLYLPQGPNGYDQFTPAATIVHLSSAKPIDFMVWDNRLFCLTSDGHLMYSLDGASWIDAAGNSTLDSSITPHRLALYFDRGDNEEIMIVTSAGLWSYDPVAFRFVRTRLRLPPHIDNGLGADMWRLGEDLFISAGIQVYRYTGSATIPMGLDRGDGLPDELRGRIVDLLGEHNSLAALVEGLAIAPPAPEARFDPGLGVEHPLEFSPTAAVSSVIAWTGIGWQVRWISAGADGAPNWLAVSALPDSYRMWWGWGTALYSLPLSRAFSNVVQKFRTGEANFEPTGYIDLGWIDHNMREFDKLASHLELNMVNATATERVHVSYRMDEDTDWISLGYAVTGQNNGEDHTILPFGVETQDDGTLFARGRVYRRIRIRLDLERGSNAATTPIMDSINLKHIKLPLTTGLFTVTIRLDQDEWEGRAPAEISRELDELLAATGGFVRMQFGYDDELISQRVLLTRLGGQNQTGLNPLGGRQLSVLALPLAGYNGGV